MTGICRYALVVGLVAAAGTVAEGMKPVPDETTRYEAYRKVVADTAAMVSDGTARALAAKHGLQILNVTWEDTGRYKGSCVGPNISDMTIQMQQMDPRTEKFNLTCMPVIRFPNFSDRTADLPIEKFYLLVGNEKGRRLTKVTLEEFLGNIRKYLTKSGSWAGDRESLLAKRDTHVLVSAQACLLPVEKGGGATFNPVLFNYQSYQGDPAVLTILCTREGTSVTVIDNKRDSFQAGGTWGQRLFFNQHGERASFAGERMSDYVKGEPDRVPPAGTPKVVIEDQRGMNMVLLIQVPLRQKKPMRYPSAPKAAEMEGIYSRAARGGGSDVEEAVIGHGKVEGPFTEIDKLEIQRDARYPIRVTVQFYQATSNGVVSEADMARFASQINRIYEKGDYVGSLVTSGDTGRPTEYEGEKIQPPDWWHKFWLRHEQNTGMTYYDTMAMLRKLYGPNWMPRQSDELSAKIATLTEKESSR